MLDLVRAKTLEETGNLVVKHLQITKPLFGQSPACSIFEMPSDKSHIRRQKESHLVCDVLGGVHI